MERIERTPLHELARQRWDVLVIGGGITGAGIFREAASLGLHTLLVEAHDFASGTSSHSGKLIHGGLHYLSRFQMRLARESVRERDVLLREDPGLVEPLDFILPVAAGDWKHSCVHTVGLGLYHVMGGRPPATQHVERQALEQIAPGLHDHYRTALRYREGQTDDARLTLRVIAAGRSDRGVARNYTRVCGLVRDRHGQVSGAELHDVLTGDVVALAARHVVNATGPWSDGVRSGLGRSPRQRIVGGSHLVFPHHRLPVTNGVVAYHGESGLPLYIVPWQGVTLVGTTHRDLGEEARWPCLATDEEVVYLLDGVRLLFPGLDLDTCDIQATYAGYRPIIDTRTTDPARASRDYGVWLEDGLITVTGGKLTTHRSVARQVIRMISGRNPHWNGVRPAKPARCMHASGETNAELSGSERRRLAGQYGPEAVRSILAMSDAGRHLEPALPRTTLAEIRWSARTESVEHLDDLLSRRLRLALLLPRGGQEHLGSIEPIVRQELGWDTTRWQQEVERYLAGWAKQYAVPTHAVSGAN